MFTKFLLLLLLPAGIRAQIKLKANDPLIRYDLIRADHYYSKAVMFDSTGQITFEYLGEHLIRADTTKQEFLFVRYIPYSIGQFIIDSNWNNANGPTRYALASYSGTRTENDVFHPIEVLAHTLRRGVKSDTTVRMTAGYLDDTSIWELFGYMALRKGVEYAMDIFGSDNRLPLNYLVKYTTDDYAKGADGTLTRLRVLNIRYESKDWNLWIDPQTHLTVRAVMRNNDNGSTLVITLV
jgi:hypothetical protein